MLASSTNIMAVVAGFLLLANPAAARRWAGSINVEAACIKQHQTGGASCSGGANNWKCRPNGYNVDMNQACKDSYGDSAYADPQGGGCYDWGCYFPN